MNSETKSYETEILEQLIKNSERLAVIEKEVSELITKLKQVKTKTYSAEWWLRFIAGAVVLSFFKKQLMSFF